MSDEREQRCQRWGDVVDVVADDDAEEDEDLVNGSDKSRHNTTTEGLDTATTSTATRPRSRSRSRRELISAAVTLAAATTTNVPFASYASTAEPTLVRM